MVKTKVDPHTGKKTRIIKIVRNKRNKNDIKGRQNPELKCIFEDIKRSISDSMSSQNARRDTMIKLVNAKQLEQ